MRLWPMSFLRAGALTWLVIAVAAAAPFLFALFIYVEHASRTPVLPLSMFRSAGTSIANAITVSMSLVLLGTIFILTQYFQVVEKFSPLLAGVASSERRGRGLGGTGELLSFDVLGRWRLAGMAKERNS